MKIGIIGLGKIAKRVAKGVQYAHNAELYAVASRNLENANEFKENFGANVAYGSYEELLSDDNVELVYICTPNVLHKEHIMLCLKYRKHVLCEKPFVSNQEQLQECFSYAKQQGCFLMEAEKTLFTPLNQKLKKMVEEGVIGKLRYIEAGYCTKMDVKEYPKDSWLFRKEDGGSFYDVGVYPICYANLFANASLAHVEVMKQNSAYAGIDILTQAMLGYENGVMAYVRSSWGVDMINQGYLYGDEGVIITDNFWKSTSAILRKDGKDTRIEVSMESDFTGEIEHAVDCIQQGYLQSPILSQERSEQIMKVLEEMHVCNCVHEEKSVK
ncbi:Gfo/Idh/MocA family protein [Amedibacillus sp. YH-ame6]